MSKMGGPLWMFEGKLNALGGLLHMRPRGVRRITHSLSVSTAGM